MAGLKQSEINHCLVWLLNICSHVHPFMDELVNVHSSKHIIRQIQGELHWLAAFCFFAKEILWLSFSLPTQPDHKILFLEQERMGQTHLDRGFWKSYSTKTTPGDSGYMVIAVWLQTGLGFS